jgi:hypothetical protein
MNRPLAVVLACVALSGCAVPLTAAELNQAENHAYPGHSRGQVYKATTTALRSLGYEITMNDEGAGRIKTAPKLLSATAHGNSSVAVAQENTVAWNIDVTSAAGGAALHAEPRGYSGGRTVPASQFNGQYFKGLFATLYGEIDSDLPGGK